MHQTTIVVEATTTTMVTHPTTFLPLQVTTKETLTTYLDPTATMAIICLAATITTIANPMITEIISSALITTKHQITCIIQGIIKTISINPITTGTVVIVLEKVNHNSRKSNYLKVQLDLTIRYLKNIEARITRERSISWLISLVTRNFQMIRAWIRLFWELRTISK